MMYAYKDAPWAGRPNSEDLQQQGKPALLEFFAGSGLVSHALSACFELVWANDICSKKAEVFRVNHPNKPFLRESITNIVGTEIPGASVSWASFPCQDLSLAGNSKGIRAIRSGLVWEWIRVMDEMSKKPPVLVAENVLGLISSNGGGHYRELHRELTTRGYVVGAVVLDAVHWVPQSRPRVFVIGVDRRAVIPEELLCDGPNWAHPASLVRAAKDLSGWVWWKLPKPFGRSQTLSGIVDRDIACDDLAKSNRNIAMIPKDHWRRLQESGLDVAPGYKRIRDGKQVLELRFDDVAGCLRTPAGGSSRQYLVVRRNGEWRTRIISPREAARLMGAPDSYMLPGSFNDGYKAMGDAVAAPVASYLAANLLSKLAVVCHDFT